MHTTISKNGITCEVHTSTYNYTNIFYYLFAKFSRKINKKFKITDNNIVMKTRFFKIVPILACIAILFVVIGATVFVSSVKNSSNYTNFDGNKLNQVYSNLVVLDDNGSTLNEVMYYKNIKQVPLSSLQYHTYMAFVAVEDKRFFIHNGIDAKRVAGALLKNVKSGSFKEGASTISQQLIKNTHLDNSKNIQRKVNEMLLAVELESKFSKEEILEMYLNTIYFGRNAYGIENAANGYFGKSASELDVSESAILAGMIKAPNIYAPDKNITKCKARRDLVLDLMLQQGVISAEQCNQAKTMEISYAPQKQVAEKTYMYYVLKEACQILNMTEGQLLNSNYTIETYCKQNIQQELCNIARQDKTIDRNGNLSSLACVLANNNGKVIACYMRGENADSKAQVGSTFKPIAVYAPALNEKIITQASPVLDEPTDFNGYTPQNANAYNGWVTIKHAVSKSLNVPAVKTLNCLTIPTAEKYLNKLGFDGKQNLSLALGNVQGGATPFELAKCYTALSNNGEASEAKFVKSITSNKGQVYHDNTKGRHVYAPTTTFLMTDMLVDVVNNGTATALKKNYQIAAKTGTVGNKQGNTDAIIAGYTSEHTFVIWHKGQFTNQTNGSNAPCLLASTLLDKLYATHKPDNFVSPKGVVKLTLDKKSLETHQQQKIAKTGVDFWFDQSNKPTEKLEEICYDYTIKCTQLHGGILLELKDVENGKWELLEETDGRWQTIPLVNNRYQCECMQNCTFFAKLYVDGQFVYQTPKVEIIANRPLDEQTPTQQEEEKHNKILDYWYIG